MLKKLLNENNKKLKKYNKEKTLLLEKFKKLKINKNIKQKNIIKKLNLFKDKFNHLDYNKDKDLKEIEKIFKENKIDILALILLSLYNLKEDKTKQWKYFPYDTQILAILAGIDGYLIEMQTGEGKSLVSFIIALYKSLYGRTINIISINHYLIERDVKEFYELAKYLNISVGVINENLEHKDKVKEYNKNIVYSTHQDIIFDYLKDNMVLSNNDIMIKNFFFIIIDEIDAILIDSALTPILISLPIKSDDNLYLKYNELALSLMENENNYIIDKEILNVELTNEGIKLLEKLLNIDNLFISQSHHYLEGVVNALKAHIIYINKEQYIIENNKLVIIDSTTGRPIKNRTFPGGIQQAIQVKEGLRISPKDSLLASITYQNFFKLFSSFIGMTGTLKTEEDEFFNIYNKEIISIPRLVEDKKEFLNDILFKTNKGKLEFLYSYVKEINNTKQPLVIGCPNVKMAEKVYNELKKENLNPNLLTASNHKEEAEIIKKAGELGQITIVTTMAGRGTDIVVSKEANDLGGVFIIGLERGKNKRIDNQLAGRVGRNGDHGTVLFLLSPEDTIMKLSQKSEALFKVIDKFYKDKDDKEPIQVNDMIMSAVLKIQDNIANIDYESRKYLLNYDGILTKHRTIFYKKRKDILKIQDEYNLEWWILKQFESYIDKIIATGQENEILTTFDYILQGNVDVPYNFLQTFKEAYYQNVRVALGTLKKQLKIDNYKKMLKMVILNAMDYNWTQHLTKIQELKTQVMFFTYMNRDPLSEYNNEAYHLFEEFFTNIEIDIINSIGLLFNNHKNIQYENDIVKIIQSKYVLK